MAQPTNSFDSYDAVGIREDLSDIIYDISPDETPFYSKCAKMKVSNRFTEWQTDALRDAVLTNAHIEGDDTVAEARTATTRLGNYTQIFKNAVVVPDTDEGLDKAGRKREIAYQSLKMAKEQKLDIEKTLLANQARAAGSDSTPRYLAGAVSWVKTNVSKATAGSPVDPTGDGTDTRTYGTALAFSQDRFNTVMRSIWNSGGKPQTVYLSSFQMDVALGFTGNNNQRNTVESGRVAEYMDLYMTQWGQVKFKMSRHIDSRNVLIMQDDMWSIGVLRGTQNTPLAKTGDNTKRQIVTELTLCAKNEKSSGIVTDNTTS